MGAEHRKAQAPISHTIQLDICPSFLLDHFFIVWTSIIGDRIRRTHLFGDPFLKSRILQALDVGSMPIFI